MSQHLETITNFKAYLLALMGEFDPYRTPFSEIVHLAAEPLRTVKVQEEVRPEEIYKIQNENFNRCLGQVTDRFNGAFAMLDSLMANAQPAQNTNWLDKTTSSSLDIKLVASQLLTLVSDSIEQLGILKGEVEPNMPHGKLSKEQIKQAIKPIEAHIGERYSKLLTIRHEIEVFQKDLMVRGVA